jgi:hypothetical protein
MNKKSGKPGTAVTPTEPTKPKEATLADPGEVTDASGRERDVAETKLGSTRVQQIHPSAGQGSEGDKVWISIELRDEDDRPVPNEPYEIKVPNEDVPRTGRLGPDGKKRIDGIDRGTCQVCFPEIHADEWKKIS